MKLWLLTPTGQALGMSITKAKAGTRPSALCLGSAGFLQRSLGDRRSLRETESVEFGRLSPLRSSHNFV